MTPWIKVSRSGFLTGRRAEHPPDSGVWVRSDDTGEFQHTKERLMVAGMERLPMDCFHGEDRHNAWMRAVKAAKEAK